MYIMYLGCFVMVRRDERSELEAEPFHVNPPVPFHGFPVKLRRLTVTLLHLYLADHVPDTLSPRLTWLVNLISGALSLLRVLIGFY